MDNQTIELKILSFVIRFSEISLEIDNETFDSCYKILDTVSDLYHHELNKLPYHINFLELVKQNENANSRIIVKLLGYHEYGK